MSKHIHAELMLQYAVDALANAEPWLLWEGGDHCGWFSLDSSPRWLTLTDYRRKEVLEDE